MELLIRDARTGNFLSSFIDDDVHDVYKDYNLTILLFGKSRYVCYIVNGVPILLHRTIMGNPPGILIDHANRNTLDNRKENLRFANRSQNAANIGLTSRNISGYKGINLIKGKWYANITFNYKKIKLGSSYDPEIAAKMYDLGAIKYFGEFAQLNHPINYLPDVTIIDPNVNYGRGKLYKCGRCGEPFNYCGPGRARYCEIHK